MSSYNPIKHKVVSINPACITDRELYRSIYKSLNESSRFLHRPQAHLQYIYGRFRIAWGECPTKSKGQFYVCKTEDELKEVILQYTLEN